jgi:hypothetical protein
MIGEHTFEHQGEVSAASTPLWPPSGHDQAAALAGVTWESIDI